MRTHVFKLAAPRALVLSVSGAVLLAGCDPDAPAPVTPTPVATASPAPGSVATGNGNGSPQGATNAGLTSTPTPDRESRDAAPAADDVIVREGHTESIVERQPRHDQQDTQPVFRSDSGSIVTLPGGVLLVLDGEWSQTRVDTLFAGQGIAAEPRRAAGFRPERLPHRDRPRVPFTRAGERAG